MPNMLRNTRTEAMATYKKATVGYVPIDGIATEMSADERKSEEIHERNDRGSAQDSLGPR